MRSYFLLFIFAFFSSGLLFAGATAPFSLKTSDGFATLNGEINYPDSPPNPQGYPLVLLVPGTGLFDREVYFGNSGTERDFVFRDLAHAFNAAAIAVARHDYRGVSCNLKTMPPCPSCISPQDKMAHYLKSCVDNQVRGQVTPENMRDDIAQIYSYVRTLANIDSSRLSILGHSEGTVHTAHLVAGRLSPKAILLMGTVGESPKEIVHWQTVERYMKIFDWDANHDGILTNQEIKTGYAGDSWFQQLGIPVQGMLSPTGEWTRLSWSQVLEEQYESLRLDAIHSSDTEPYPKPGPSTDYVMASYRWWKMWFTDTTAVASLLAQFRGKVIAYNGSIDSQTPGERELGFLKAASPKYFHPPTLILNQGLGHGMSTHPLMGPLEPSIRDQMVRDLKNALN